MAEVLAGLRPRAGGRYVDGTLGGGGHARAILQISAPDGFLIGCDRDEAALEASRKNLAEFAGRVEIWRGNFAELNTWVAVQSCDGVLLDLGVSSLQLTDAVRGFSFLADGPLDMRMDRGQALTAAILVNERSADELARLFWEFGDEPHARRLARAIERERALRPFETTKQLADLVERLSPRRGRRTHPATQVFQALRIAVNDEMGSLTRGLSAAVNILKSGGRLAVITFHSLEDRIVKHFGRELARDYDVMGEADLPAFRRPRAPVLKIVTRKAVRPSEAEVRENPRARSAQLRVFEKV
ncbi:MAG: 16S rRNA (cytosine(1402)-N(4))-methyltransferase RsmH [Verrucomicrobia bacterium]|nr:16S rRNA (cytosine(1402)-N(4))-methyltransferase RsmH [Verrucomicrobiota bacterium]